MTINKANGWLASDGSFFERQIDAEQYDARHALTEAVMRLGVGDDRVDKFISAIDELTPEIQRYINAHAPRPGDDKFGLREFAEKRNKNRKHQASDEGTKSSSASLQSLPADGRVNLSDLGRNSRTEAVPE